MFKSLLAWVLKNGWNLFSVVGVIGTFYFAIVYVPDYVKEISDSKTSLARESLSADLQEIFFYDKTIGIADVESLIRGREIKLGLKYPYSAKDLLLEVQDRFIANKFIPLDRRHELVATIENIISSAPVDAFPPKKGVDWLTFLSYAMSALGVLIGLLGWKSLSNKLEADREISVDIAGGDMFGSEVSSSPVVSAAKYEELIADILKDMGVKFDQNAFPRSGIDFVLSGETPPLQIEVKAYQQLLGLRSAQEICSILARPGWNGILVVASGLTKNATLYIEQLNSMRDEKIYVVTGREKDFLKKQLADVLRP